MGLEHSTDIDHELDDEGSHDDENQSYHSGTDNRCPWHMSIPILSWAAGGMVHGIVSIAKIERPECRAIGLRMVHGCEVAQWKRRRGVVAYNIRVLRGRERK